MRRVLGLVLRGVAVLLLVPIALFAWGRLRAPTPVQAEAMRLLQPVPVPAGNNAWPVLWLQDVVVPADQIDAVYARERADVGGWLKQLPADAASVSPYASQAVREYPERAKLDAAEKQLLCHQPGVGCLAKVRAQGQPLRDLLARQSGRLAQWQALDAAAILWDDMPGSAHTPLPSFHSMPDLRLTAAAVDFVEGRQEQALAAVCRQAVTVRRLHAHTNSLVGAMVTVKWMESTTWLLAEMLAEVAPDQAVPATCAEAFVPPVLADADLCAPMRHEYEWLVGAMAVVDPARRQGSEWVALYALVDIQGIYRLAAPGYAWACSEKVKLALQTDRPFDVTGVPPVRYDLFDTFSNYMGVILARVDGPNHTKYLARNQDYTANLRLMAWLLATRGDARSAADWQQRLTEALPGLQLDSERAFTVDPDGRYVRMSYREPRQGRHELVLPLGVDGG